MCSCIFFRLKRYIVGVCNLFNIFWGAYKTKHTTVAMRIQLLTAIHDFMSSKPSYMLAINMYHGYQWLPCTKIVIHVHKHIIFDVYDGLDFVNNGSFQATVALSYASFYMLPFFCSYTSCENFHPQKDDLHTPGSLCLSVSLSFVYLSFCLSFFSIGILSPFSLSFFL